MEEPLAQLIAVLGGSGNLIAVIASVVLLLFRDKILDFLASLGLPVKPKSPDDKPGDEEDEIDSWLENHPLLDRLWKKMKEKYLPVVEGDASEDDRYVSLLRAIESVDDE